MTKDDQDGNENEGKAPIVTVASLKKDLKKTAEDGLIDVRAMNASTLVQTAMIINRGYPYGTLAEKLIGPSFSGNLPSVDYALNHYEQRSIVDAAKPWFDCVIRTLYYGSNPDLGTMEAKSISIEDASNWLVSVVEDSKTAKRQVNKSCREIFGNNRPYQRWYLQNLFLLCYVWEKLGDMPPQDDRGPRPVPKDTIKTAAINLAIIKRKNGAIVSCFKNNWLRGSWDSDREYTFLFTERTLLVFEALNPATTFDVVMAAAQDNESEQIESE